MEVGRLRERLDAGPTFADDVCTLRGRDVRAILAAEFGVANGLPGVYVLLHRFGYSCLDPRPPHPKSDPIVFGTAFSFARARGGDFVYDAGGGLHHGASQGGPGPRRGLAGFRYFRLLGPLLGRLHPHGVERDRAGNRRLFYDQYVALLLMYFFTPALTSLRGLQQATGLDKVAKALGVGRTSLGALSEAAGVFDPRLLRACSSS